MKSPMLAVASSHVVKSGMFDLHNYVNWRHSQTHTLNHRFQILELESYGCWLVVIYHSQDTEICWGLQALGSSPQEGQ